MIQVHSEEKKESISFTGTVLRFCDCAAEATVFTAAYFIFSCIPLCWHKMKDFASAVLEIVSFEKLRTDSLGLDYYTRRRNQSKLRWLWSRIWITVGKYKLCLLESTRETKKKLKIYS